MHEYVGRTYCIVKIGQPIPLRQKLLTSNPCDTVVSGFGWFPTLIFSNFCNMVIVKFYRAYIDSSMDKIFLYNNFASVIVIFC